MKWIFTICLSAFTLSGIAQVPFFTTTVHDSARTTGYYFFSTDQTIMILDRFGDVVYYRNGVFGNGFTLQPNGMMSYAHQQMFFFMDSTFIDVDSIQTQNIDVYDTHELQVLPDSGFALLGRDLETMDLSSYHFDGQYGSSNATVSCGVIQEMDKNKNVRFEWHAKDHLSFGDADTFFLAQNPVVNWNHSNGIELDDDGNFLLSHRHLNEITKISRTDSSVIWRLGGNQNEFTFVNFPVPFYGQHTPRRLRNGHLSLFDNGNNYSPHGARALEFELDEVNKIATLVWSYTYDSTMYSRSQGNCQRLDNENTLINYGPCSFDTVCFIVVDSSGSKNF